jgi:hypothetical protein
MARSQCAPVPSPEAGTAKVVPFATEYLTLTKQEHIRLVMKANTWKSLHSKAIERVEVA